MEIGKFTNLNINDSIFLMKTPIFILTLLASLTSSLCFSQEKPMPVNLSQAIKFLDIDCPDSLKQTIKSTPDDKLKNLGYPWGGKYKTVFEWTNKDSEAKIREYLSDKGVSVHQDVIVFRAFKNHLLGVNISEKELLRPYQEIEQKWNKEDQARYTTDTLRGVYIPRDLEDCFKQIDSFWNDSTKLKVKQWTEDEFSARVHFGFGMWMRNNWQLWGGSRLSKYFNDLGVNHPDDMSGIILDSYHRYLNQKEIKLDEQVLFYKNYWKKAEEEAVKGEQEAFEKYAVGDTVVFNYNDGFSTPEQESKYDNDRCIAKGKVLEKDPNKLLLTVLLLETCDKKGIISFDNKDTMILNPKIKKWEKPKKRIIRYLKTGQTGKFEYSKWETQ
jgi:hypothetical protein